MKHHLQLAVVYDTIKGAVAMMDVTFLQDKYNRIQSILSHVQAFRQRSREQEDSTHRWHSNNHRPQGVSNLATSAASSQ